MVALRKVAALAAAVAMLAMAAATGAQAPAAPKDAPASKAPRALSLSNAPRTGDFDAMRERRLVRFLVPYSRTLFFNDRGVERGIAAELARDFERHLNRKYGSQIGKRPITVVMIVTTRDRLLADLAAGLGDVAAGNLTVTPERQALVDFVGGEDRKPVRELLVTGPASPPLATLDDLAGKTVHVRRSSSYHASLVALNARLQAAGKPPAVLILVPDSLEDEDMMEMTNAGLLPAIVVDDWKAGIWARVLPKLVVRDDLVLRDDARMGWAIRKGSPLLAAEIDEFYRTVAKKQGLIDVRIAQFNRRAKQMRDPTASAEWKRFEATLALFRKYGAQYHFDPLMLVAQGYQESGLDQAAKSHVGAIGVMQVMPATGAELRVGDIRQIEANIHAGAKYLDQLMTKYFADAKFDDTNRPLFAFASYNCGPGNVARARREAEKRGLDPDVWFNNVEVVVAERIGMETTGYVRNIYKYYAAYRLIEDARAAAERARGQVSPSVPSSVPRKDPP